MEILLKRPKGRTVYVVFGESFRGRITKRDGKPVTCGHMHRSPDAARACLKKARYRRPGNCQTYRVGEVVLVKRTAKARKE